MPALWIAQLLCPARHAICALLYDIDQTPAADIETHLLSVVRERVLGIDPWCGLCGSRELHVEHSKLPTDDWTEATLVARLIEAENLATRERFHERKRSTN